MTVRQVAEIFGKAFVQASTMSTAVNGFRKCGIWPYDPTVFSESDFAPSLATNIPQVQRPVTQAQTDREEASTTSNIVCEAVSSMSVLSPEPENPSRVDTRVSNMATSTEIPAVLPHIVSQTATICILDSDIPSASDKQVCMPASNIHENNFDKATPDANLTDLPTFQSTPSSTPNTSIPTETLLRTVCTPRSSAATVTSATALTTPATSSKVLQESVSTPANEQPQPGCSTWPDNFGIDRRPVTPRESIFSLTSPVQVLPFPATQKTVRSTRKRGKTAVITASPYKNELRKKIRKKRKMMPRKKKERN